MKSVVPYPLYSDITETGRSTKTRIQPDQLFYLYLIYVERGTDRETDRKKQR